ncbi:MAG: DUF4131 domain-containing protein [Symploca sp. SIO2C1]|nr:DUF4131 domain-containing protein [Symploca sp. SIO2C1]
MNPASGALLSLAYILGLLSTAILGFPIRAVSWEQYILLVIGFGVLGLLAAITLPRFWRTGPRPRLWLATGIVAALAVISFQMRIPQPASNEISKFVDLANGAVQGQVVTVQGKVESIPRQTRNQRSQFWLQAKQLNEIQGRDDNAAVSQGVRGQLYVTVPLLQATGLYPGQRIAITGLLYAPLPPKNPGAFDFQAYLARQGAFAGLSGLQITNYDPMPTKLWGWWKLRVRILRAQVRWLGSPTGQLVSTMVLGRRAVDLPYEIRDEFIAAGLAHVLAASGFHISLILGLVLGFTRRMSGRSQFIIGLSTLLIYVGLTGLQPSVMRAAIMGLGALIALLTQRKTKPLGSLLIAATILLLWNPLWIWDLGFELSFLATLGLLVTAPPLIKQLDWLPPALASLIAVPLAASLWTLPLQLYVFYTFAPYSLAVNIICTPLIALISIGGVLSAVTALILPLVGSTIAWFLEYPVQLLVWLVGFFNELPGSQVTVGKISLIQLLLLYGILCLSFINHKWRRRWWLVVLIGVTLVIIPVWQTKLAQFQVTVLATAQEQVLVIQDQGKVTLVNSGEGETVTFTVLPFLQQQGVNQIDWAVAFDSESRLRSGWLEMLKTLPIKNFYDTFQEQPVSSGSVTSSEARTFLSQLASAVQSRQGNYQRVSLGKEMPVGSTIMKLINTEPPVLQLQINNQTWLLLGKLAPDAQKELVKTNNLPLTEVLWFSGKSLTLELLQALQPKVVIASSNTLDPNTAQLLLESEIIFYFTGRDGAIQWTPHDGFETTLEVINKDAPLL